MNAKIAVDIIIFATLIFMGFIMISRGRVYLVNTELYTPESLKKFSKPLGLLTWLLAISFGIIFLVEDQLIPKTAKMVGYGGIVVAIFLYFLAKDKILERKKEDFKYKRK